MKVSKCYQIHRDKIDELITRLQKGLIELDEKQAENPDDWELSVEARYVKYRLHQICRGVENVGT